MTKKDYPYPLYAPWTAVEAGKKKFREWLEKQSKDKNERV
tara:strand:+ start:1081 stop:1200 length:120 start_codon:yes stop_codon:yes gene_type:complete